MSVDVKFNASTFGADDPDGRYEDGEGREYRYEVLNNGALAIFEKEEGKKLFRDTEPIAVFGPSAWFSVTGDARSRRDAPGGFASV
jgi:hypothetical protein